MANVGRVARTNVSDVEVSTFFREKKNTFFFRMTELLNPSYTEIVGMPLLL